MPIDTIRKLKSSLRKIFLVLLFVSSFLIGAVGSYIYLSLSGIFVKSQTIDTSEDKQAIPPEGSYNVLLLGYGGAGHDGGNLSDALIVVSVNPEAEKVSLISIPRDLWVEIPIRSDISQSFKINHAYAIGLDDRLYPLKEPQYKGEGGGATLAKKVVGEVAGMQINFLLAVDFEGFKNIIDSLGGVEVDVPVAFDDYFYPIKGRENDTCGKSAAEIARLHEKFTDTALHHQFECRYEHIYFAAGSKSMDGEVALKFARSRSGTHGGDFARSERQHSLLTGVKDKLLSIYSVGKVDELFNQFVRMVKTDLDLATVRNLAQILGNPQYYKLKFVGLSEDNVLVSTKSLDGQFILIPKEGEGIWTGVQNYIFEQISSN